MLDFSLDTINVEEIKAEVIKETEVVPAVKNQISDKMKQNAAAIINCDINSLSEKQKVVSSISQLGARNMQVSTQKTDALKTSVGKLSKAGSEGSEIATSLIALDKEVKGLDPSGIDFAGKGLFNKIVNPVKSYFQKYEKSDSVIKGIVVSIENGKKTLQNDNKTLAIEQHSLRELSKQLATEIEMSIQLDDAVSAQLEEEKSKGIEEDRLKFIEEEVIFPLRQRIQGMQQMMLVNHQGIISMEVIQKNNAQLIRSCEQAATVTVSALRTAVMVAEALYNQRLVLSTINALNDTTNKTILATSRMLKETGTEIHKKAIEANISPETLKESFRNVLDSLDEINTFKQNALPIMRDTIEQFRELADTSEAAIIRMEKSKIINE